MRSRTHRLLTIRFSGGPRRSAEVAECPFPFGRCANTICGGRGATSRDDPAMSWNPSLAACAAQGGLLPTAPLAQSAQARAASVHDSWLHPGSADVHHDAKGRSGWKLRAARSGVEFEGMMALPATHARDQQGQGPRFQRRRRTTSVKQDSAHHGTVPDHMGDASRLLRQAMSGPPQARRKSGSVRRVPVGSKTLAADTSQGSARS